MEYFLLPFAQSGCLVQAEVADAEGLREQVGTIADVYIGVLPFMVCTAIVIALIILFPDIATRLADPNFVFAASLFGELYSSGDAGDSWEKLKREFSGVEALAWVPQLVEPVVPGFYINAFRHNTSICRGGGRESPGTPLQIGGELPIPVPNQITGPRRLAKAFCAQHSGQSEWIPGWKSGG